MKSCAWLAAVGLGACAASLKQVPASEPHGVLLVRFDHPTGEARYERQLRVDGPGQVIDEASTRLRLAPGRHSLVLTLTERRYALGEETVLEPRCADPYCNTQRPTSTTRQALVDQESWRCEKMAEIEVTPGTETEVVLRAEDADSCTLEVTSR